MIDYWKLTKDFAVGDFVQKFIPARSGFLSPYMGRVLAVLPGIGFVDVQWPFGAERVSPEDLVKVNPSLSQYLPPQLDFGYYPGYDARPPKVAYKWASKVPSVFHKEMASLWHRGLDEVHAYDVLWHKHSSMCGDATIRGEVRRFYAFSEGLAGLFFEAVAKKKATYWNAPNRQHRATRSEVESGKPMCPKCKQVMRKTTYKVEGGQRIRLFACPKCLYLIKNDDILGPDGNPVSW